MRLGILLFSACGGLLIHAQERALRSETPIQTSRDRDGYSLALPAPENDHVMVREVAGEWVLSLRVASSGAAGLQLFVENMRLPEGGQLAIYQIEANGDRGPLAASYSGSGPLSGDPFWSAPVTGHEALVEVTLPGGAASALPLRLASLRHLTSEGLERLTGAQTADGPRTAELEGTRGYARYRGAVVPYEVRDGMAVFEGDILLGPAELIQPISSKGETGQRESMGITNTYYRWTAGVVPYEIDPTLPNQYRITDAVAHWNTKLAGTITLRPRNGETHYIRFVNTTNSGSCSSYIGYNRMAAQPVTIGSACSTGNVIHEVGHAIGLYHEHTREDRNTFVKINTANIDSTKTGNFSQQISVSDDLGAYDYGSIMHYPSHAFSINGLPTIETIPAGISIGQRSELSAGDIGGVQRMYPTVSATAVPVTIGSNPSGMQLVVDNVTVTAPASFQWAAGSSHTISAPNLSSGSSRTAFRTWSDGGAQTHTITVPTSSWTVTANYQRQHMLTSASSNPSLGMVSNSPASADLFYNEGASVSIVAQLLSTSACLAGWTGVSVPPATSISVTINQPLSVTGNFQSGSISVAPTSLTMGDAAGTGSISVSASGSCPWMAKSNASWISIISGASGSGSGMVQFSVLRKTGKKSRTGTITVGPVTVTINQ